MLLVRFYFLASVVAPLLVSRRWCADGQSSNDATAPPQLNGANFRITAVAEDGFVNIDGTAPGDSTGDGGGAALSFSGYCIDMLRAVARPERANFTFDLLTPSGYGSQCSPRLTPPDSGGGGMNARASAYGANYRSQYKCGESDVTDVVATTTTTTTTTAADNSSTVLPPAAAAPQQQQLRTDMYLSLYYVTPKRQLTNQFTQPFDPPGTGTLTMFGTATGVHNFAELAQQQEEGIQGPACAGENAAYIDYLKDAFPTMLFREVPNSVESFLGALRDGTCTLLIIDYPVATRFVLQRSLAGECFAQGKPIGVIGDSLGYGLNHYAIGIRSDIPPAVVDALSYWLSILMICSPGDPLGDCPASSTGGNLYDMYDGVGGTGAECGYVLDPPPPNTGLSVGAIAGIAVASAVAVLLLCGLVYVQRRKKKEVSETIANAIVMLQRAEATNTTTTTTEVRRSSEE